jgi:GH24 family phage-related lysozyme (muramidase)
MAAIMIDNQILVIMRHEEGFFPNPYDDNGDMSVGYGYNITAHGKDEKDFQNISKEYAEELLIQETAENISACLEHLPDFKQYPLPRQFGFISMVMQMGEHGVFVTGEPTMKYARAGNWAVVGKRLRRWKWAAKQTSDRAAEVIHCIETGEWHPEYKELLENAEAQGDIGRRTVESEVVSPHQDFKDLVTKDVVGCTGILAPTEPPPGTPSPEDILDLFKEGADDNFNPILTERGLRLLAPEKDNPQVGATSGSTATNNPVSVGGGSTQSNPEVTGNTSRIGEKPMTSESWKKITALITSLFVMLAVSYFNIDQATAETIGSNILTAVNAIIGAVTIVYLVVQGQIDKKKQEVKLQEAKNAGIQQ